MKNFPTSLLGQKVLVLGGGVSGKAALRLLKERQAIPVLCNSEPIPDSSVEYVQENISLSDLLPLALIVKSPGVSPSHSILLQAAALAIPVVSEVELARAFYSGKLIGVTGTDGKSTTTSLTCHLVSNDFPGATAGGNIGLAFSDFCMKPIPLTVLELSSYQLEDSGPLELNVSVILNLASDHLERHKSLDKYFEAKTRIVDSQNPKHTLVTSSKLFKERIQKLDWSCNILVFGREAGNHALISDEEQTVQTSQAKYDVRSFPLPGGHNLENLAASILAAEAIGAKPENIQRLIGTFQGLPHRFQYAGKAAGVSFINDSKSTNLHSMLAGLSTWKDKKGTFLILGGRPKAEPLEPLKEFLSSGIGWVLLIGEAREKWASEISPILGSHLIQADNLEEGFSQIKTAVRSGRARVSSVVFSPACASFDLYKNFEERGDHFLKLVGIWSKEEP
ncbi:UDP-N-acetylmuramoyl-L-alanine--D-glutamate ligase [Leptospira langatensis]|uniref:UDP-N-acetylmuramoylalanine--D-glutamate ligase n=1 Tax=Leptospira langatensis TaxID=2484983 RepID=A0A5F1ZYD5_9LEPT|nr:UDP-N-acetylmuramoyl-L-alanine--D-glutamate ligase [Leptospira langatensis]TGK00116.1 UDP-N-acetylmuramoyl-L-alanine--D-glutamate ligase [Leptospira langatensis]TGL42750.1 UDP-N-acetylmuramoyl-L-alanine--D-glutamate ligase [Leptospira langatensis]